MWDFETLYGASVIRWGICMCKSLLSSVGSEEKLVVDNFNDQSSIFYGEIFIQL